MPLADKSNTKSSKSVTSNTPLSELNGVGPKLRKTLEEKGLKVISDFLYYFPKRYEIQRENVAVSLLKPGERAQLDVQIISARKIRTRTGKTFFEAQAVDQSSTILLKWFYFYPSLEKRIFPGSKIRVSGEIKEFRGQYEMVHPDLAAYHASDSATKPLIETQTTQVGAPSPSESLLPVYSDIEGLHPNKLRGLIASAHKISESNLQDDLPPSLLSKYKFPALKNALYNIHFPILSPEIDDLNSFQTPSQQRFIFEEFFKFQLLIQKKKASLLRDYSPRVVFENSLSIADGLAKDLPFELTLSQTQVLREILLDLTNSHPMNRLVQGDVGSGKTAVALLASAALIAEGYQVAFMAPTEILARQHLVSVSTLFQGKLKSVLWVGGTKTRERLQIQERIDAGEPLLIIGTHALIEDQLKFKKLGLVIIDEQHRFGVEQRATLRKKGAFKDDRDSRGKAITLYPHVLVLTATPIPRTLALTIYGELDVSSIRELPKGRAPIRTKIATANNFASVYAFVKERLEAGEQAYVIFPLIETSTKEGFEKLRSVVSESAVLASTYFPSFVCKVLHGQMPAEEKDSVMREFKEGRIHVLCSTTVVEVGVDVPNATTMIIQNAERFGLSQLHQLRGRVGRGSKQGYCFLFTETQSQGTALERLSILEKSTDGFVLAEKDLTLRGPGDFLGTKQTGVLPFKFADLARDSKWLFVARDEATAALTNDPDLNSPEHYGLRRFLNHEGNSRDQYLKTL